MNVSEALERILTWCTINGPLTLATLNSGLLESELICAERAGGFAFPDELRFLYLQHNGSHTHDADGAYLGTIVPGRLLAPESEMLGTRSTFLKLDPTPNRSAGPEGSDVAHFDPAFQPFGVDADYSYIVDAGPSEHSGWIRVFDFNEQTKFPTRSWRYMGHFLGDIALVLENDIPFDHWSRVVADEGALDWEVRG